MLQFDDFIRSGKYNSYIRSCQDYCTSIEDKLSKNNNLSDDFPLDILERYKNNKSGIKAITKIPYKKVKKLEKKHLSEMVALRSHAVNRELEKILKDIESTKLPPEVAFKKVRKLRETMQRKVHSPQRANIFGKIFDRATVRRVKKIEERLVKYCNKDTRLKYYMDKRKRNNFSGKIAALSVASNIGLGILIGMFIGA
ncbi:MAG: hypothetical protein GY821_00635 [Gammaproteobacteria bacterium]|nr:hypothetical protein [Gammaproteobacteria bacterium]